MKTSSLGSTRSDKGSESRRGSSTCASHGELVWDQIEAGSEPGHEIKNYVDRGKPVADNTIVDLARTHLQAAGA